MLDHRDLTKTGDGRLWLFLGNHTYSGNTIISDGTFNVVGTLADSTNVSVASGAIYDVDNTDTINSLSGEGNVELSSGVSLTTGDEGDDEISGVISGAGNLVKAGSGMLRLTGTNTYTGTTTINAGKLSISNDSGLGAAPGSATSGHLTLNGGTLESTADFTLNTNRGIALGASNGIIDVNSGTTLTYGGIMAGSGTLTKVDSGTLTLSGVNTYSGSTTITGGALAISADNGLGAAPGSATAGHLTLNGGTLQSTADFTLNSNRGIALGTSHGTINVGNGTTLSYNGIAASNGNLTKSGTGTLVFGGANSYTGDTIISAGTFQTTGTLADTTDVSVSSGAIYDVDATDTIQSLSGAGNVELASGITLTTGDTGNDEISGVISGAANLTKAGSGTLTLSGTNTFTGDLTISAGTVTMTGTLADSVDVVNSGTYDVDASDTIQSLSGSGAVQIATSQTLTTGDAGDDTISGVISGAGNFTKAGSGTLTLSGTNTLTGSTTISAGTLQLGNNTSTGSLNSSSIINNSALVLDFSNDITLSSDISGTGTLYATARYFDLYDAGSSSSLSTSSWTQIATSTTVTEVLQRIAGGYMHGDYVTDDDIAEAGISVREYDPITNTANFRIRFNLDSGGTDYTKQVSVVLRQNGANVEAKIDDTQKNYTSGGIDLTSNNYANLGEDDSGSGLDGDATYATSQTAAGYGLRKLNSSVKITLTGALTYSGTTTIEKNTINGSQAVSGGDTAYYKKYVNATLEVGGSGSLTSSAVTNGGNLILSSASNFTLNSVISGAGTLIHDGSAVSTLSANNTYTGATYINAGAINATHNNALGATAGTTTVLSGGALNLSNNVNVGEAITISGTGVTNNGAIRNVSEANTLSSLITLAGNSEIQVDSGSTLTMDVASGNAITGSYNLTIDSIGTSLVSDPIATSTGTLTKTGAGTLTLSATNTYTGSTTINAGTVSINDDSRLGAAPGSATAGHLTLNGGTLQSTADFTLNSNRGISLGSSHGTINVDTGTTLTYGGIIAGSNNLTKAGNGTLILSGVNTYSGNTTISAGKLYVSGLLGSGNYSGNISNSGTFEYASASNQTISGVISGTGDIVKGGSGELTLSGNNTYSQMTMNDGYIIISSDSGLGAPPGSATPGHLTFNGGTLQTTASFTLNSNRGINLISQGTIITDPGTTLTYGGIIAGSGNLIKAGTGTLVLTGNNTNNGFVGIHEGALSVSSAANLGAIPGSVDSDNIQLINGTLHVSSGFDLNANKGILLQSGSGSAAGVFDIDSGQTLTIPGVISGNGTASITKNGSGTLTLTGTNTHTATTTINAGKLTISNDSGLGAAPGSATSGHLTLNGGTLESTADFTLNTNRGIALGASNGIIDVNSGTTLTYGGIMAGSGTLTKVDSGTLTLSGVNTYSGSTTITGGALAISADNGLGAAPGSATAGHLTLNGGTLQSTADFTLNSNRGIALGTSHGTINVGNGTTLSYNGIAASNGNLTKSGTGTLVFGGANSYTGDTIISAGTFQTTGTLADTTDVSVSSGAIYDVDATDTIQSLSGAGNVELASGITLTTGDTGNDEISGVISGAANLTKAGSGTLTLSGTNTFTGDLTISAGTVTMTGTLADSVDVVNSGTYDVDASDTIQSLSGSGAVQIATSQTLTTGDAGDDTISGVISGAGNFTKAGSGTLTLSGTNTYTGSTTITAGTVSIANDSGLGTAPGSATAGHLTINGGTLQSTADFTLSSNRGVVLGASHGTFNVDGSTALTIAGIISGANNIIKSGNGTLILSGINTYSGATTISAGTLNISGQLGSGNYSNTINNSGVFEVSSSSNQTISGVISNTGNLIKSGSGTLTLSATNTYTGTTTISGGVISINGEAGLGAIPGSATAGHLTLNGGTLKPTATFTLNSNRGIALGTSHGTIDLDTGLTLTYGGIVAGSNNLTKSGSGTLLLSGANSYSGQTIINAGKLQVTGTLADTNDVLVSAGATYDVDSTDTIQSLSGAGAAELANSITLTTGDTGNDIFSGVISGAGSFSKAGSGTLTLSGINTYTGTTTISAGTISIAADSGLGAAPGSATPGHLILNGGALQSTADFTLNSNRGIALGGSNGIINVDGSTTLTYGGIIAGSGSLTKIGSGILILTSNQSTYSGGTINSLGTLRVTSGSIGSLGSVTSGPIGTGSLTNNATFDVVSNLIHNTKSNSGSIINKPVPSSSFSSSSLSVTYGDTVSNTFTTDTNGTKTFSSSNTNSATINSSSGAVTLSRVGNATMSVSLAETNEYASASDNYALTINPKTLTATASTSNKVYDGGTTATTTLSFSGLIGSETLGQTVGSTFDNKNVGTGKTVTVNSITLADGNNGGLAANYSISPGQTTTANVTTKALTVSGITASNKTYDATTSATLGTGSVNYGGLVSGDDFAGSYSGVFANANVGSGKTVNITSSYSGSDVSNYSVTNQSSTTADISAKALTATASASNKVYDGSSTATTTLSLSGFIGSETVTSTNSSTFNNKNAGTGKTVTVNSITLADGSNGGLAANYSISTGQTTTANITAKSLTVSGITASNKIYDGGTTAATTLSFSGLIGSETLGQTVGSTFDNKNVGTGKTVTVNSITLADGNNGGLAANYSISPGQTTTANVTTKALTVSGITASNKTYDATTSATLGTGTVSYGGLVSGDDFAGSYSGVFANANVGSGKTVTITSSYSGSDVSNYSVTNQSSTTADISAKALTATASASNKVYDGSSTATTTLSLSGFIGSETVTSTNSSTFNNKNAGTGKTVTVNSITLADGSNGGLAANYSISTGQTTTANITAKSLTVSGITASNKIYDGNATATLDASSVAYSGLVSGDTFNGTFAGAFSDKNVGTGKTITITPSYSGADVSNYSITNHADLTANITTKALTVSGVTASNKTYDGSVIANMDSSSAVYSGFVSGDDFAASYSGVFANANVGSGKTVTITSSYAGNDVSNYSITNQSSTTADINAKILLLSTFSASDKPYDGNNTPTITSAVSGFVGTETVNHSVTATFDNKNVGSNKVVTANSITLADGTNGGLASNYSISTGQTTTADITAKTLTATASASNKTYDGLTTATTALTFSGLIGAETLGQSVVSTFNNKNVGNGKTVTVNSIALADGTNGGLAGNYSISPGQTTTANITAKALTVSGITASNKNYDSTTSATLISSSVSYSGLITGDIFTGSYTGVFANANVGTGKTVNITSSYSGADAGNYTVTDQSTTTANITAKVLTATASASNKTYDGGTTASTTLTFTGLIGSETLGQTVGSTFDNKNVGTGKTVTVNSITLADGSNGGLAANYSISAGQTTTANITAKSLTVSGITASNKTYDGGTNATLDASSVAYSGLISGDTFNGTYSGAFSDKNVGSGKTIAITSSYSGADVSNYSVTDQSSTTANITAKALTVSGITASSKTYDGGTSATLNSSSVTYTGLLSGDTFTGSYSGVFANANVGTGKTVNITSSYSGSDVNNYSVTDQSSTTADISTKALTATALTANKAYDGGTTASTTLTLSGLIGSETLASTTSSSFNNKNVGTGKTVTVNSITLADGSNGGLAANYSISAGQTTTANITAKSLTVSGITASNKIYDGNTVATLDPSSVTYSGLVSGDSFAGSYSGLFSDKNIGTGKTVSISSSYSGSDVNNYTITDQASTTANITSRPLGVTGITVFGLTVNNKEYDGTVTAPLDTSSISYSGLVDGDDFTGSYSGVFANANVGNGKAVTITSSYSGADAGNYTVTDQSNTTGNIVPKVLTATASASNKTYDGATTATNDINFFRFNWLRDTRPDCWLYI